MCQTTGLFPVNLGQLQTTDTCTVAMEAEVYRDDGGSETLMSIPDPRYLGQYLTLLSKIFLLLLPTWQSI